MPVSIDNNAEERRTRISDRISNLEKILKIYEEDRIKSFKNWAFDENEKCSVTEMAKAGFFFTGTSEDDDSATCFVCGKVLDGWENTDDPWLEHQKHSANCKFVQMRRAEDELTVEEFLDLFKCTIKQYLTHRFRKEEASLVKRIEKVRDVIKHQQF